MQPARLDRDCEGLDARDPRRRKLEVLDYVEAIIERSGARLAQVTFRTT
jgi:hypothetical protein